MEQLRQLEQNLIDAAVTERMAVDAAIKAEKIYDEQWEKIAAANPEFKQAWEANNTAAVAARAAKSDYGDVKAATVKVLLELPEPDDMKVINAFGYQLKKVPILYPNDELVMQLVEANAFGLLLPDKKQIEKFVIDNAFKDKDNNYLLPEWIVRQYGGTIRVESKIKPTISDPIIAKQAK